MFCVNLPRTSVYHVNKFIIQGIMDFSRESLVLSIKTNPVYIIICLSKMKRKKLPRKGDASFFARNVVNNIIENAISAIST